ncbi:MAG: hypothetical protein DRH26_01115 [Deltaproteobacteria bacterium]|nr:MAG: hypothetical protein DRH26_01115 [Deltaproteobacteria bacterium]
MPLNVDYTGTDKEQAINSPRLKAFLAMSPVEVGEYIDSHVIDLATAKDTIKDMAMILAVMKDFIKKQK